MSRKTQLVPLLLIVSLFFLWGAANNLNDVLIAQFRKAFTLSDFASGLVQSAFYLGYLLFAIPAGLFMRRFSYKRAVIVGLVLYGCGALLFYPAAEAQTYEFFLVALFIIAGGLAFLETSANPLVTVLGDPAHAERRLNLAQAFNPFGSIVGVAVGSQLIFSDHSADTNALDAAATAAFRAREIGAVQIPYLVLGMVVLAWAVLVALTRFPAAATRRHAGPAGTDSSARLIDALRKPRLMGGVVTQFLYVGAQVGVWSYTIRYAQAALPGLSERDAAHWLTGGLVAFMAGRFIGVALMRWIAPLRLLALFAVINVALTVVAALWGGVEGLWALAATSFFMSVMYPTIFANSVRGLGDLTQLGSSLLVMAIVGGAVITAIMGLVSDGGGIALAMLVPAACFAAVAIFAATGRPGSANEVRAAASSH